MSQFLAALMSSVHNPLDLVLNLLPSWLHQLLMLKHSRMCGFPRTKELRESLGIRDDAGSSLGIAHGVSSDIDIQHVPFFKLTDDEVVLMFGKAFKPELQRLMQAEPTAEVGRDKTPGELGPGKDLSPSRLLYDRDFPEINRSIVGVLALKWVVTEDYDSFSKLQTRDRIDEEAFAELREFVLEYLRDAEELYALVVATIANDLGKDPSMLNQILISRAPNSAAPNHDEVMYLAAQQGGIEIVEEFPMENPVREALILGLKFGAELNMAQFIQAENVPGSLRAVKCFNHHQEALQIKFLEILFDVAGAAGHRDSRSAIMMSQAVWKSYHAAGEILMRILAKKTSLRQGYDEFLEVRAELLLKANFRKLDVEHAGERALLRLMTMARVIDLPSARIFDTAFADLSEEHRDKLVAGLSVDGVSDGTAVIPYYAPALFANTMGALAEERKAREKAASGDEACKKAAEESDAHDATAIGALFRFLVRVFADTRPQPELGQDLIVECSIDFAQATVKGKEFLANPGVLDDVAVPEDAYSVPRAQWL